MKNRTYFCLSLFLFGVTTSLLAFPMTEEDKPLLRLDARNERVDGDARNAGAAANAGESEIAQGQRVFVQENNQPAVAEEPTAADNEPHLLTLEDVIAAAENFSDEERLVLICDERGTLTIQDRDGGNAVSLLIDSISNDSTSNSIAFSSSLGHTALKAAGTGEQKKPLLLSTFQDALRENANTTGRFILNKEGD